MALFGFGDDDADERAPREKGFFSNVGSFLWTAIKWAAIAVVAVATLGAVFHFSKTARDFVDKHTGGEGQGWASSLLKFGGLLKEKADVVLNPHPTESDVSDKKIIKTDKGDVSVPMPRENLTRSPIVAELAKDPEAYDKLKSLQKARAELEYLPSEDEKNLGNAAINSKRDKAILFIQANESWTKVANEYNDKNKEAIARNEVPSVPVIDIPMPKLTARLEAFGKAEYKEQWDSPSLYPSDKFKFLEKNFGAHVKGPDTSKFTLEPSGSAGLITPQARDSITSLDQVIPENMNWENNPVGRLIRTPQRLEESIQSVISKLIEEKRFSEASIIADGGIKRFNKLREDYAKEHTTATGTVDEGDRKNLTYYTAASKNFEEIKKYAEFLQRKEDFAVVSDQYYSSAINAAKNVKSRMDIYAKQVDEAIKKNNPEQATDRQPTEAELRARADADRAREEASRRPVAPAQAASAPPPPKPERGASAAR